MVYGIAKQEIYILIQFRQLLIMFEFIYISSLLSDSLQ
jgi:hypothetical protein